MEHGQLSWIANFTWGIADDVLRDLYIRGKYRDVVLPMTVLRRLDAVLEPTKQAVLDMKASLDKTGIVHQRLRRGDGGGTPAVHPPFSAATIRSRVNALPQLRSARASPYRPAGLPRAHLPLWPRGRRIAGFRP